MKSIYDNHDMQYHGKIYNVYRKLSMAYIMCHWNRCLNENQIETIPPSIEKLKLLSSLWVWRGNGAAKSNSTITIFDDIVTCKFLFTSNWFMC